MTSFRRNTLTLSTLYYRACSSLHVRILHGAIFYTKRFLRFPDFPLGKLDNRNDVLYQSPDCSFYRLSTSSYFCRVSARQRQFVLNQQQVVKAQTEQWVRPLLAPNIKQAVPYGNQLRCPCRTTQT